MNLIRRYTQGNPVSNSHSEPVISLITTQQKRPRPFFITIIQTLDIYRTNQYTKSRDKTSELTITVRKVELDEEIIKYFT